MNKFDIYLCKVHFTDKTTGKRKSKIRPILIIDDTKAFPISHPITHHTPRSNYNGDYSIIKWKEAGLDVPSTVRLNYIVDNSNSGRKLLKKLGELQKEDIANINKMYNSVHPKNLK